MQCAISCVYEGEKSSKLILNAKSIIINEIIFLLLLCPTTMMTLLGNSAKENTIKINFQFRSR